MRKKGKVRFFGPNFHTYMCTVKVIAYLSKGVVQGCMGYLWQSYCSLLALENAILTHLQPLSCDSGSVSFGYHRAPVEGLQFVVVPPICFRTTNSCWPCCYRPSTWTPPPCTSWWPRWVGSSTRKYYTARTTQSSATSTHPPKIIPSLPSWPWPTTNISKYNASHHQRQHPCTVN